MTRWTLVAPVWWRLPHPGVPTRLTHLTKSAWPLEAREFETLDLGQLSGFIGEETESLRGEGI